MKLKHLLVVAATTLFAASANAQSVQVEQFEPLPAQRNNILGTAQSEVLGHLTPSADVLVHYADAPLRLVRDGQTTGYLLKSQLHVEVGGAIGLFDWFEVGFMLPIVAYQDGDAVADFGVPDGVASFALADVRVVPKVTLVKHEWTGGFGVGLLAPVYVPTGDSASFNSDGVVRVEPRLVVDWELQGGAGVAANVGYQFREAKTTNNLVTDNTLKWSVGAHLPVITPRVQVIANVFGAATHSDADTTGQNPVEAQAGFRFDLPYDILVQAGGGIGLNDAVGTPGFRAFAGVTWSPAASDVDQDGIDDRDDACPQEPEDLDGFEDADGCPDDDNDGDGIQDRADKCPQDAEDFDQLDDRDGCPEDDVDGDGVLDTEDKCPETPGKPEQQGCPLADKDNDGVFDDTDQCPELAEDVDGFEDADGCPDVDNDRDGIPDASDECPQEPEVVNGVDDEDGCPDEGEPNVRLEGNKAEISEKIQFDYNAATIKPESHAILDEVAALLKANAQITLLQVEGHTDDRGFHVYNLELSKLRAEAVRDYLIAKGIAASRLRAIGLGESDPIAKGFSEEAREKNRRVEFRVVEINGEPVVLNLRPRPAVSTMDTPRTGFHDPVLP
ncbi:MAG: OmpA family protein [bacterium]